jgi:hypothetical protein
VLCVCDVSPLEFQGGLSPIGNSIERFELMITPIDSARSENVSGLAEALSVSSGSTKRTPNKSVVV